MKVCLIPIMLLVLGISMVATAEDIIIDSEPTAEIAEITRCYHFQLSFNSLEVNKEMFKKALQPDPNFPTNDLAFFKVETLKSIFNSILRNIIRIEEGFLSLDSDKDPMIIAARELNSDPKKFISDEELLQIYKDRIPKYFIYSDRLVAQAKSVFPSCVIKDLATQKAEAAK